MINIGGKRGGDQGVVVLYKIVFFSIEVPVPIHAVMRVVMYICVLGVYILTSFYDISDFENVPTVWYFLLFISFYNLIRQMFYVNYTDAYIYLLNWPFAKKN